MNDFYMMPIEQYIYFRIELRNSSSTEIQAYYGDRNGVAIKPLNKEEMKSIIKAMASSELDDMEENHGMQ